MTPIFLDFETFWSQTHSLTKLNPFDYVMHPETEIISCALKIGNGPTEVVFGEAEISSRLQQLDWEDLWAIGHNMSGFDALLMSWRLGIRPRMWGCTMAMARPHHAKTTGLSLGALVKHYKVGVKDNSALIATKGRHLCDFTPAEIAGMRIYNRDDTDQCAAIFFAMLPLFTPGELWHIHAKINSLVASPLELDVPLLEAALREEKENKRTALIGLAQMLRIEGDLSDDDTLVEGVRARLASAPKFADLLASRGVPVPLKESPTDSEKQIPALAKTDEAFLALQEHADPVVAAAARVRLSVKSTITETRIQAFIDAARFTDGKWPVTSHYCGADTTGRGSGWHYNPYNLPKIKKQPRTGDALRKSIRAPKGCVVVVADLSGIEMRFNHFLWKVPYSTQLWQENPKADVYRAYMAQRLGVRPEEVTDEQRFASKVENLGLGYGMGALKFQFTARVNGGLILTLDEAQISVNAWRAQHPEITHGWQTCHEALDYIAAGKEIAIDPWGLFTTCAEGIRLPSGRLILYPNLRKEKRLEHPRNPDGTPDKTREPRTKIDWVYGHGRHKARIYAGKVDENIVQAGARDVMYEALLDIYKQTGYEHVHEVYDEGVWVIPEAEAPAFLEVVHDRLRRPPAWWKELVTYSEGAFGSCYAECK